MNSLERYCISEHGLTIGEYARKFTEGNIEEAKDILRYDWGIDNGNTESGKLTEEGKKIERQMSRSERPKGMGYKKEHKGEDESLIDAFVELLKQHGATEIETGKNFREITFKRGEVKTRVNITWKTKT